MRDEPIDDIIREAADEYSPAFDEKAWEAMRQKLDTHLPQKTSKRRYLLLFLLALLGSGAVYLLLRPADNNKLIATTKDTPVNTADNGTANRATVNTQLQQELVDDMPTASSAIAGTQGITSNTAITVNGQLTNTINPTTTKTATSNNTRKSKGQYRTAIQPGNPEEALVIENNPPQEKTDEDVTKDIAIDIPPVKNPADAVDLIVTKPTDTVAKPVATATVADKDKTVTKQEEPKTASKTSLPSPKKSFASRFSLLLSGGADLSYLRLNNSGTTTLLYGAGLGYQINKRWMVRAGVYSVEKVYSGDKSDYTLPQPVASNPNLYEIDAECRVYEIPVSVSYSFGATKKHAWFGSVGVASMLMKSEDYLYHYKVPGGTYNYSRAYSVRNENNHYFSVLALSAGYQYRLNNRFSLLAEPYVKLPLTGIGAGKVKLQSMGIMLTAAIRPFGKR